MKCSGEHPSCKRCINRGLACEYAKEGRVRGPNKPKIKAAVAQNLEGQEQTASSRNRSSSTNTSSSTGSLDYYGDIPHILTSLRNPRISFAGDGSMDSIPTLRRTSSVSLAELGRSNRLHPRETTLEMETGMTQCPIDPSLVAESLQSRSSRQSAGHGYQPEVAPTVEFQQTYDFPSPSSLPSSFPPAYFQEQASTQLLYRSDESQLTANAASLESGQAGPRKYPSSSFDIVDQSPSLSQCVKLVSHYQTVTHS